MKFGVFDHMDDAGIPHGELFAGRRRIDSPCFGSPLTRQIVRARPATRRYRDGKRVCAIATRLSLVVDLAFRLHVVNDLN